VRHSRDVDKQNEEVNLKEKNMKKNLTTWISAMTLFATLAIPARLAAQEQQVTQEQEELQERGEHKQKHRHYILKDLGTFGGPASYISGDFIGGRTLNNRGTATGSADTSIPDPNAPNCANPDCFVSHTFRWKNGVLTDLGALPGVNTSSANEINERGWIVGSSGNGVIGENRALLWKNGDIIDLGTLGGTVSFATGINNREQIIGASSNTVPDPFSLFGFPTQTRTFIWENGVIQDLGTLGGPDAAPSGRPNERGQVCGYSYTSSTPNPDTGMPTQDPFLWENGTMTDLGTLGGTIGFAQGINNRGQVIGHSNLAGNLISHPFLWHRGVLTDLGTLGGDNGMTSWINDAGEVVGEADLPGSQTHNAFLWKNGVMTDLGNLGQTSFAFAINSKGQVVGASRIDGGTVHAFLWEKGSPMIDLNAFVPSGSSLQQLTHAFNINDRGEIYGRGVPPGV
jgi:probable HAF family extracellular repeat protein